MNDLRYARMFHFVCANLCTGQLSLAIPPWAGRMSSGYGYGHRYGRIGEFCVTVGPVTRSAGTLTQMVKDDGC